MLNLTSNERKALILTVTVIIAGGAVQLFQSHVNKNEIFDYTASDSIFYRLSYSNSHQNMQRIDSTNTQLYVDKFSLSFSQDKQEIPENMVTPLKYASININSANSHVLQQLPRIGPAMAKRIIEFRRNYGKFNSVEDLLKVKGIGKKTLEKIKPYIKI
jgi:comEA protein